MSNSDIGGRKGGGAVVRMSVGLHRQASESLEYLAEKWGVSKTDAINRALSYTSQFLHFEDEGYEVELYDPKRDRHRSVMVIGS